MARKSGERPGANPSDTESVPGRGNIYRLSAYVRQVYRKARTEAETRVGGKTKKRQDGASSNKESVPGRGSTD